LRQFKDKAGLSGHLRFSHPGAQPVAATSLEALRADIADLRQMVKEALGIKSEVNTEVNTEVEDKMTDEVITKKDMEIMRLQDELKATEAKLNEAQALINSFNEHIERFPNGCSDPETCPVERKLAKVYHRGRADALTDPTPDEVPKIKPRAVGDWLRYYRDKEKREKGK
jgi:hypothetical protein